MNNHIEWKCLDCGNSIEEDDNYCHECGHWTAKGYKLLKNQDHNNDKYVGIKLLVVLLFLSILVFVPIVLVRGNNMYKPFIYIKKRVNSYNYGYNTSLIKNDNIYEFVNIESIHDAKKIIYNDYDNQDYLCNSDYDVKRIEYELENTYDIASVKFCDISIEMSLKIKEVIEKIFATFPNSKGALTNITIANAKEKGDYIAYFQPIYQFVNVNQNIGEYNKVNKTQILLNSYYFLNDNKDFDSNLYIKDSTLESTVAHELGHYITFNLLLKEYNLNNILLVTKDNEEYINDVVSKYDEFALSIVLKALNNYNDFFDLNETLDSFVNNISVYASTKNKDGTLNANETIAEAIHDYYLHDYNANKRSLEIIKLVQEKFGEV